MTKYCSEFISSKGEFTLPGGKAVRIGLICVAVLLFVGAVVGYLFEVNKIAAKGFAVRDLEKQISQLKEENEKLRMQIIDIQTMPNLLTRVDKLQMVKADNVVYYQSGNQVLVRR